MIQRVKGRVFNARHLNILATWYRKYSRYSAPWNQLKSAVNLLPFRLRQGRVPDTVQRPRLTPQMVTSVLNMKEDLKVMEENGPISSFVVNELQANQPTEDRNIQGHLVHGSGWLFGVIDGHGGWACAQVIRDRLFSYIAVAMADPKTLANITEGRINPTTDLVHYHGDMASADMEEVYKKSLTNLAAQTLAGDANSMTVQKALTESFLSLDKDIVSNALPGSMQGSKGDASCFLETAFAGAVSVVAYVDDTDLYVANVGDSQAVLGVRNDNQWTAVPLSFTHDADNAREVERITKLHPNESSNVIKRGRLFGELMPLRAFGDARFKWAKEDLEQLASASIYREGMVPNKYLTPPYLDAEPEVMHHMLTPKDKFLVLASDGLWDCLSPEEVVRLVAGHMDGQQVLVNYSPTEGASMKDVHNILSQRKGSLKNLALDSNVATHLLRSSLGPDHGQVSAQLTLPESVVRNYRDDITITVIFFNSEFMKEGKVLHRR